MKTSQVILKNLELPQSQDYGLLRSEGLRRIERMAHRIWTDYNVHDPGVTILELVSYAITDLGYRIDHPIEDILTRQTTTGPRNESDFHTALEILTCNPVTFYDMRKILVDIRGIRNAWVVRNRETRYCIDRPAGSLRRCSGGESPDGQIELTGLYDVLVEHEDFVTDHRSRVGLVDRESGAGQYVASGNRGIRFDVARALTLEAVHVYAESPGEVTVRLTDLNMVVLATVRVPVDVADTRTRVRLGFEVPPGVGYRLDAVGSGVRLYRSQGAEFGSLVVPEVIDLVSGVQGDTDVNPYFFFYDWQIDYASWQRVPVGLVDRESGAGQYVASGNRGIRFDVARALTLEAVHVYAESPGEVTVRLTDLNMVVLATVRVPVDVADTRTRVRLGFEVPPGVGYRLDAVGSGVRLYRSQGAEFGSLVVPEVIDLVSGVQGDTDVNPYFFFYDWQIDVAQHDTRADPVVSKRQVAAAVIDRIHRYRNLAEDVVAIRTADHEEIALCADLDVEPSADVESVIAEIFSRLEHHVSPGVRFYTIEELRSRGRSTDQIFQGPILSHGFIDDEEFRDQERRCEIRTSDIVDLVMDVEGVRWVKNISLLSYVDGALRERADWVLPLVGDELRTPVFSPELSRVVLYKSGLPYYPNQDKVGELVAVRSSDPYSKLEGHDQDLPVPVGRDRKLAAYSPIQNELPPAYMVGQHRVPPSRGDRRSAQSRQLKGYLMFFEQLLANFLAQLDHVPELFSWSEASSRTYFTQAVTGIADLSDVYDPAQPADWLDDLIESDADAAPRRERFLDHLIARFCEDFTEYSLLVYALDQADPRSTVIADKRRFLTDYPKLSRERATAYDYRYPRLNGADNLTGYQRRVYGLLGIHPSSRRRLGGSRLGLIERSDGWRFVLEAASGSPSILFESIACESPAAVEALLDTALAWGADEPTYEALGDDRGHQHVRRNINGENCGELGRTTASDVFDVVVEYFDGLSRAEGFHVVEHLLLRPLSAVDPLLPVQLPNPEGPECVEVADPYSFRATVVLPSWPRRFADIQFRRFVERTLREEAPAHVFVRICWVSHTQMQEFEDAYEAWGVSRARHPNQTGPSNGASHYAARLAELMENLHGLINVHPLARLHDDRALGGDAPAVTLDNTNLGTF